MIPIPSLSRHRYPHFRSSRQAIRLVFLLLMLSAQIGGLIAAPTNAPSAAPVTATNAPASTAPAVDASGQTFGQYLVAHQEDLKPFFSKNYDIFIKESLPVLTAMFIRIVFITYLIGWVVDILLSRGFATFFAPALAKIKRSLVYATGELVIGFLFTVVMSLIAVFGTGIPMFEVIMPVLAGILFLAAFIIQVGWVTYLYRTAIPISIGFYLAVLLVHILTGVIVAAPMLGGHASEASIAFVDSSIVTKLKAEVDLTKQELKKAGDARDQAQQETQDVQAKLTAAQAEQADLQASIEQKKNSEAYLFSRIARVHAQGDLDKAHDQYAEFLAKFPSGALSSAAKTQLDLTNSEIAAREAKKKQDEADAAAAAAAARTDLLARADQGKVTLSEMRQALLGKTLVEVKELFGLPHEIASDRWGYSKRMIYDPIKDQKWGLTVNFSQGIVQGVDYYYPPVPPSNQ